MPHSVRGSRHHMALLHIYMLCKQTCSFANWCPMHHLKVTFEAPCSCACCGIESIHDGNMPIPPWKMDNPSLNDVSFDTTVPHPHGHWQLQELRGNQLWIKYEPVMKNTFFESLSCIHTVFTCEAFSRPQGQLPFQLMQPHTFYTCTSFSAFVFTDVPVRSPR